ncbi:MAG: Ig-like domain-containing protein [Methanosarcinaceae archaeon]|nr:Ig-like domain-containing protein [Methanosarcinaceae archaeon]
MKQVIFSRALVVLLSLMMMLSVVAVASAEAVTPGTAPDSGPVESPVSVMSVPSSLQPVVTETGKISLSVDGLGMNPAASGIVDVEKPAGATVRGAYLVAASTGFSGYQLVVGDVTIAGAPAPWSQNVPSAISSWNHWADVTAIVKPTIDSAPAGTVPIPINETVTRKTDGVILAVIFDDPNQVTDNTIVLLFGAQDIAGDTFNIGLADPIDTTDPNLVLDMSLGISFGYQQGGSQQYSIVDVNGARLTTAAGGEDDGQSGNGALITVGGLGDSNANPADPYATPTTARSDDELYNLIPFVRDGDTSIGVFTSNPSNDDNIFFSAFFMGSTTAVVGEGILLSPTSAVNPVGTSHTVTATVQDDTGAPVVGRLVSIQIMSGPNAGMGGNYTTDASGQATFTYTGTTAGIDVIEASCLDSQDNPMTSNQATKTWTTDNEIPEFPTVALPIAAILGLAFFFQRRRNE